MVDGDDERVQNEPRGDEDESRRTQVDEGEPEEEGERQDEHREAEVAGRRHELQEDPGDGQRGDAEPHRGKVAERASRDESDPDGGRHAEQDQPQPASLP